MRKRGQQVAMSGVTVKVYNVDIVKWEVSAALTIRAYHSQTMAEFRQMVADKFGGQLDPDKMRCVRERYNELKLLGDRTIKQEGFIKSNKVFVECSGSEDDSMVIFSDTAFHRLLSQYQNTICLRISLPSTSPDESGLSSSKSTPSPIGTPSKCSEQQDDMDEGIVDLAAGDFAAEPSSGAPSSPEGHENVRSSCLQSGQQASVLNAVSDAIYKQYLRNSNPSETETETEGVVSEEPAPSTTTSATTWNNDVDWCVEEDAAGGEERNEESRFYQADLKVNPENNEKELRLRVDKRTLFRQLKKYLEPFVGTTSEFFKVYKIYSNNQDIEITYLSESLNSYSDDCRLVVRLGRALKKGEHRIKIHQLAVNSEEPSKFMCEVIIARGMSVLEAKVAIAAELRQQCQLEVPIDRMRLRKKAWKNPGTIFKDTQLFEEDITIMSSSEIFFEILDGPECVLQSTQLSLYIRRWRPSQHKLDPMQEIVLDDSHSVEGLKRKARGTFPYEMSVLDIPTELDWNPQVTSLNMWPMSLCDDGLLVFFRDKTEELGELADEKKKEIQQEENVRLAKYTSKSLYSPRKERALKIYTDDTPSPDASNTKPSFLMEPL
ncbi:hypothetical protein CAPTEDRAFT_213864 [Capitella teleta]|uniref:Ubiquitin carboxyl-terminal hydrolase 47 C-terminal domain-containing protein n=1 Tax=Capitella teleta TaxID=283909 RepID=R7U0C3_CAPTE|nr:hypothetical protein CAPTEDRAFT_213864 [Capitella teleta]|eukprot:ELT97116.1 hypothetical protein CAPTEDRAFT_213864 [Capitella teleta]